MIDRVVVAVHDETASRADTDVVSRVRKKVLRREITSLASGAGLAAAGDEVRLLRLRFEVCRCRMVVG